MNKVVLIFFVFSIGASSYAEEVKVIGAMRPMEAAMKLEQIGEVTQARKIRNLTKNKVAPESLSALGFFDKKSETWKSTNHVIGFISQGGAAQPRDLIDATSVVADQSLQDQTIKITLDRLRVFAYPGGGLHTILFDFYGRHMAGGASEDLHFSQTYRALEGEGAGVSGYPIFVGLKLGKETLGLRIRTVNVKNENDEKFLSFLDSDTFKSGLQLINATNPLTPVLTKFATGITESVAKRNQNVAVQDIDLGMDFSTIGTRPKLSQGSYIAIQTPVQNWDWTKWKFFPDSGQVLSNDDKKQPIPYNYIIFSISRMQ